MTILLGLLAAVIGIILLTVLFSIFSVILAVLASAGGVVLAALGSVAEVVATVWVIRFIYRMLFNR